MTRLYLLAFFAALGIGLIAATALTTGPSCDSAPAPVAPAGQLLATNGMDEPTEVAAKLALLRNQPLVDIGIFGNHVVETMAAADVQAELPGASVYNFTVPHATVEELVDYVAYVQKLTPLPKTLLIGITDPNHGNGENILGYQYRMARDVYVTSPTLSMITNGGLGYFRNLFEAFVVEHLDWQSLLHSVLSEGIPCRTPVVQTPGQPFSPPAAQPRQTSSNGLMRFMPPIIRRLIAERQQAISSYGASGPAEGWLADGRLFDPARDLAPVPKKHYTIDPREPNVLSDRDVSRLTRAFAALMDLAQRSGSTPIFFVSPRLQPRHPDTAADHVVDEALRRAGARVIDTRPIVNDETLTIDGIHPSAVFTRWLIRRIVEKGWL